ncbi:MAG TPA: potassium/proton antiporter [Steroidobacteraceae bacterium]|nr:potassium/proton antiporter [Steroidobacteraceae bacterium]
MDFSYQIILLAGVLSLLAVLAGFASVRIGTPLLLALIGVGILAGEDGPGGIRFDNFQIGYLIGSLSLAVILFQGGISTTRGMLRGALWPSVTLATLGVAISACVIGLAAVLLLHTSWPQGLLLGAATAPTDAAAVVVLLRFSGVSVPDRVKAALELESGLNDPMSVFLTLALVQWLRTPTHLGLVREAWMFLWQMGGGAAFGLAGGYILLWAFQRLRLRRSTFPLLALGIALTVFGGTELAGASGFLAVYLTGMVIGNYEHPAALPVSRFFETLGWLAQNALFLMLGLLITPHRLLPLLGPALMISAVLVVIARPLAVAVSLTPFRWKARESAFIAWAGLRGGVPIYLTIIPLLQGLAFGRQLFEVVFVVVVVSVAVQGTTVKPVAKLLGLHGNPSTSPPLLEETD